MAPERRRILYSGNVQGVGFRWRAASVVEGLPISGYVRNLSDGRVEVVIEGEPKDNEEAAGRIRSARALHIARETPETTAATGEFQGFRIRR
jgi:acylphosphatase